MTESIFITGVGQRVGYHLAKDYLERDIHVVGCYRTERDSITELRELGAHLIPCDFYHEKQVANMLATIKAKYRRLRGVVHNASDWLPDDDESGSDTFEKMMRVHALVPYQINLALAPLMQWRDDGPCDIIHITDNVTATGSAKHAAYAASKAALENLSLSFAKKFAPRIKVNAIAPALIKFNDHDDEGYKKKAVAKALIPMEGGYQEMINAVTMLLQSQYVTGVRIPINGGRHLA